MDYRGRSEFLFLFSTCMLLLINKGDAAHHLCSCYLSSIDILHITYEVVSHTYRVFTLHQWSFCQFTYWVYVHYLCGFCLYL